MFEINREQMAAQEKQLSEWRHAEEKKLAKTDNELFRKTVEDMTPMLSFAPEVFFGCYPTIWSVLN